MTSRAERRHPEVALSCDWPPCHAQPGQPCTNRANTARETPHPGRKDRWIVAHTDCPECNAPAGTPCAENGQMRGHLHPARVRDAEATYAKAVEAASRDMDGGRR